MRIDLTTAFAEYLAGNRGPVPLDPTIRQPTNYGILAALEGRVMEAELTFRSGSAYCCYEWGCHIRTPPGKRWDGLRRQLRSHGIACPPELELRWACVIEEGAIFFDLFKPDSARRGWYAFAPVEAQRYQGTFTEMPDQGVP